MRRNKLKDRRILVVEDEYFQAREVATVLEAEGAIVVGPTSRASDAEALLAKGAVDAAVLDINLGSGASFSTAEKLQREGIPFAFLTGYGKAALPPELEAVPCLEKPASERALIRQLCDLL